MDHSAQPPVVPERVNHDPVCAVQWLGDAVPGRRGRQALALPDPLCAYPHALGALRPAQRAQPHQRVHPPRGPVQGRLSQGVAQPGGEPLPLCGRPPLRRGELALQHEFPLQVAAHPRQEVPGDAHAAPHHAVEARDLLPRQEHPTGCAPHRPEGQRTRQEQWRRSARRHQEAPPPRVYVKGPRKERLPHALGGPRRPRDLEHLAAA
mmetsp:Transcript_18900/g.47689  ORF Transcript_18900/g.47689 Transcript_18900/m.47689 type:complete len:207 (+) Transcript_18900:294-914(+)